MEPLHETNPKNPRRVAAGQLNGRLAKNRKTIEGRAASARNSAKHLLCGSAHHLLPHEDPAVYQKFHQAILHDLAPQDTYEFSLASTIILELWQLNRCAHRERVAMHLAVEDALANPVNYPQDSSLSTAEIIDWRAAENCYKNPAYQLLLRYKTQHERSYARYLKLLNDYRKQSKPITPTPFLPDEAAEPSPELATVPAPESQSPPAPEPAINNCETKVSSPTLPESSPLEHNNSPQHCESKVNQPAPDRSLE